MVSKTSFLVSPVSTYVILCGNKIKCIFWNSVPSLDQRKRRWQACVRVEAAEPRMPGNNNFPQVFKLRNWVGVNEDSHRDAKEKDSVWNAECDRKVKKKKCMAVSKPEGQGSAVWNRHFRNHVPRRNFCFGLFVFRECVLVGRYGYWKSSSTALHPGVLGQVSFTNSPEQAGPAQGVLSPPLHISGSKNAPHCERNLPAC